LSLVVKFHKSRTRAPLEGEENMPAFRNAAPAAFIWSRRLAVGASVFFLAACATFSEDGGLGSVSSLTRERTGQPVTFAKDGAGSALTMNQLLSQPLTAETAVQVALLNNRNLQASLAELGIAEADLVQAGRLRNPGFSFGRMRGGEDVEIERGLMFSLLGLLTMPVRVAIEQRRFEQGKLQAASDAVRLAADTRKAYFNAVAAQQTARYMEQVKESAEAGAELAQRLARVGNWSKLDQAREQGFHANTIAQLARARHQAIVTREQLTRLLGLTGKDPYTLPDRLPDIPNVVRDGADIETQAIQQRLDVQLARRVTEATAAGLGLAKATGFVNVLDLGYANKSETGKPRADGYQIELQLPLFDWGAARNAKAEAIYMQSVHRAAAIAIRAQSEVREAYSAYRTAHDLARHYRDEVVPLQKKISQEVLLRYNGMLASVFELLADARAQSLSVNAAIEAQRDFLIAETDLQSAISGSGATSIPLRGAAPAAVAAEH
jgi:outer membrane protein TolC